MNYIGENENCKLIFSFSCCPILICSLSHGNYSNVDSRFFAIEPNFLQVNFVGKLLGPQGSTIKRLQEETGAKISVLGKGSMRDKNKVSIEVFLLSHCAPVAHVLHLISKYTCPH